MNCHSTLITHSALLRAYWISIRVNETRIYSLLENPLTVYMRLHHIQQQARTRQTLTLALWTLIREKEASLF